ncbi:fibronectin type III domain-containing protein [Flavobacterium sp. 3HN19-14]|uniref:fibronectin type III domain-containing protein n=1 Tax=Flavobacterium sp. 3HN19-14 TaxID=3448133 RepID=UPI003EE0C370
MATNATTTSITATWTIGNGNNRSVFVSDTNSFTDPVNGVSPGTASAAYSGTGQKLVYDGTGTSVTVTGLTVGTTYYFRVYESRKCTSPNYFYNTTTAVSNPVGIGTADKLKYTITRNTGITYTPVSGSAITVSATTGTSDDTNYGRLRSSRSIMREQLYLHSDL